MTFPAQSQVAVGSPQRAEMGFPETDLSNADRFGLQHSDRVRFNPKIGWRVYNEATGLWSDNVALVKSRAIETVRSIYQEAAQAEGSDRKRLAAWAMKSESAGRIQAMLTLAEAQEVLHVEPQEFDADPWFLGTKNGVVDLRTGELHHHSYIRLMTKQANASYGPVVDGVPGSCARHPMWDRFLETMLPDPTVREFVQMAAGYSLTGDASCESLFFVYGPTRSGKSTFTGALREVLGDYAVPVNFDIFLRRRGADTRTDMAPLWGARLALSTEVDRGRSFATALVKSITGLDSVKARHLYHEEFEFRPQFKLWLVANDRPRADADDDAFWRRMIVIPFEHSLPPGEEDPEVKKTLLQDPAARDAILAWAIEGCLMWQAAKCRLEPPAAIEQATSEYRGECVDELADFFAERVQAEAGIDTPRADVVAACHHWCEANRVRTPSTQTLARRLKEMGFGSKAIHGNRLWVGLRLIEGDMMHD